MSRHNLRPAFRNCPRAVLVMLVMVTLPVYVAVGVIQGIAKGYIEAFRSWNNDLHEVWRLDE
jgi:hypothetical protein